MFKRPFITACLFGSLAATSAFAMDWPTHSVTGQTVQVSIADLHPTQPAVGYREVDYKINRYRHDREKRFDEYCESGGAHAVAHFDENSTLADSHSFTCKDNYGAHPNEMKTAVLAPDNHLYLTDGHHTYSAFSEMNPKMKVYVRITDDRRNLPDMKAFWNTMEQQHQVWLRDPKGETITPAQLPAHLGRINLANDPYRSLIYFTKKVSFNKPTPAMPFLEFYWERWMRVKHPIDETQLTSRDAYLREVTAVANEMVKIRPVTVLAQGPKGAITAGMLGVMPAINEKQLKKLTSEHGKLTYAFMH